MNCEPAQQPKLVTPCGCNTAVSYNTHTSLPCTADWEPSPPCCAQVLSDELDEDHFHHRHLKLRQQLQRLATQAALSGTQQQRQDAAVAEEPPQLWEDCCSMQLQDVQLQRMLQGWAAERTNLLQLSGQPPVEELVTTWEVCIRQHCGCGRCTVWLQ